MLISIDKQKKYGIHISGGYVRDGLNRDSSVLIDQG